MIWCYDLLLGSSIGLLPLQLNSALVLSFILFVGTEIILFASLFGYHFNMRFNISYVYYLSYPLFLLDSIYSFGFPFSNVLLLLYSSFPLQCSIIYVKSGMRYHIIDSLSQSVQSGYLFLILQLVEFITSLSSIFDSSIYSVFYFITSIHGFHVGLGVNIWFHYLNYISSGHRSFLDQIIQYTNNSLHNIDWSSIHDPPITIIDLSTASFISRLFYRPYLSSLRANLLYLDFHSDIILWSSYWHFIDIIWLFIFQLLY